MPLLIPSLGTQRAKTPTFSSKRHVNCKISHPITHILTKWLNLQATEDAWNVISQAVKPLLKTQQRRRLRSTTTTGTALPKSQFKIPPEVINAISSRVKGAIQQAIQNPEATQAFLASLPALQGLTPATPLPSIPLANITQAIKQYKEISDMMDNIFTATTKSILQGPALFPARRLHSHSDDDDTANSVSSAAEKAVQSLLALSSKRKMESLSSTNKRIEDSNISIESTSKNHHSITFGDLREQLKRSIDSADRLKGGGIIPSDDITTRLVDSARTLEDRYKSLQSQMNEPYKVKVRSNRNLKGHGTHAEEEEEYISSLFDDEDESRYFDESTEENEDAPWLSNEKRKPMSMHQTVVMIMSSDQAMESTAMLHDMLSFLQQVMDVAQPLESDSFADDANAYSVIADMNSIPDDDDDFIASSDTYRKGRHMLAHTTAADYDYQFEDMYYYDDDTEDDNESWLLMGENTEMFERAIIGYHDISRNGSTSINGDDVITDLVVSLMAPVEDGGIPLTLLQVLTNPSNTTIADLLQTLSTSPGSIHLEASTSSSSDDTSKSNLPRFAVFGSSTLPSGMHAAGALAQDSHKAREGRNTMTDLILQPLSSAVKGPTVHDDDAAGVSGTMDARWWGVVLSLGFLGFLLVITALTAMSRGSVGGHQLLPTEDTDVSVRGGNKPRKASSSSLPA